MQLCLIATAIVVVWVSIGIHLVQEHDDQAREAIRDSSNLAYAAEESIGGMIAGIDQLLLSIRTAHATAPRHFDIDTWIGGARVAGGDSAIAIVDRNGMQQPNAHHPAEAPLDISDRSQFVFQQHDPGDKLFISEPQLRGTTGQWSVQFSRKITAPDGSFDGVVVLSLDPSWLTRLYATLNVDEGALMVVGADGIVRARAASSELGMGQDLRSSRLVESSAAADHGSFRSISTLDGVDRFVGFRRLPDYPLTVSVALNADHVFAPYVQDRLTSLIVGAVLSIVIVIVGARLTNQTWRLLRSRQVLSAAVENIDQGLLVIDENRQLPLINGRAIELLSIPPEILAGAPSYDRLLEWQLTTAEFGKGTEIEERFRAHAKLIRFDLQDARYERTRPDGRVLEVRTQALPNSGAVRTYTDISERKRSEQHIRHMAHHDGLTGLANRTLLHERLSQAFNQAARNDGVLAVLALDLDRFKAVNDGLGHLVGDRLLVEVAERLRGVLRTTDTLARVGGDEFVVVQTDVGQPMAAGDLAQRLTKVMSEPFQVGDHTIRIGSSIGIALYPGDGDSVAALLRNADTALYRAKAGRRGTFCFFEAQMDLELRERMALEQDLRAAIGTKQLRLEFQPIFASATRSVTGFEALLRWQHPVRGNVVPKVFIPIAEETGMILEIGVWVLEQACVAAAAWPEPKRMAVNLSAAQLRSGDLPALVADILRRTGLPAELLELEVTETHLIDEPGQALATLRELQDMGVRIACDDFGTGYSSFSYLQNLTFNRVKIDQSFVRELGFTPRALRIIQAIIVMAHSLGMQVTAEGVETERQFSILRDQGCDEIQGFLLGRPVPGDEAWRGQHDAFVNTTDRLADA